jgi:hypothetical protein
MRSVFTILVLIVTAVPSCAIATLQSAGSECEMDVAVRATAETLDDKSIEQLFDTADESCSSDTAFMAVFNEALFNALDRKPRAFLHYFSIFRDRAFILDQIENPVHETVAISRIMEQLADISPPNQATYDELVSALRFAARKLGQSPTAR